MAISKVKLPDNTVQPIKDNVTPRMYLGTCPTAAATVNKVVTVEDFPLDSEGEPLIGTLISVKFSASNSATAPTLNVNSTGAHSIWYNAGEYASNSTPAGVAGRYTHYFWDGTYWVYAGCGIDPSTSNTIAYRIKMEKLTRPMTAKVYRYRLLFSSADNTHWVPANTSSSTNATASRSVNQTKINPFGLIVYYAYTTAINAEASPNAAYMYTRYNITLGYSFNTTGAALTLTTKTPVYLKMAAQTDGTVIIDSTTPYVQTLPSTEDGKLYLYLGDATGATTVEIMEHHPIYFYKDGQIRLWTNVAVASITVDQTYDGTSTNAQSGVAMAGALSTKANDANVVHRTGNEDISGNKRYTDTIYVDDSNAASYLGISSIRLIGNPLSLSASKNYETNTAEDFSWIKWWGQYVPFPPSPGQEPVVTTKTLQQALDDRNNLITDVTVGGTSVVNNKIAAIPTIPAAQVNSDWNAGSGVAQILNKPDLSNVLRKLTVSDIAGLTSAQCTSLNEGDVVIAPNIEATESFVYKVSKPNNNTLYLTSSDYRGTTTVLYQNNYYSDTNFTTSYTFDIYINSQSLAVSQDVNSIHEAYYESRPIRLQVDSFYVPLASSYSYYNDYEDIIVLTFILPNGNNTGNMYGWSKISLTIDYSNQTISVSGEKLTDTSQPQGGFLPNVEYNLGTLTGNVTFSLASAVEDIPNKWYWCFKAGATAPTITWPSGLLWPQPDAEPPTIEAGDEVEVEVKNGHIVALVFKPAS